MFAYDFMRHAFAAATIVALVAGPVDIFSCCAGRHSPAMLWHTSALPERPERC